MTHLFIELRDTTRLCRIESKQLNAILWIIYATKAALNLFYQFFKLFSAFVSFVYFNYFWFHLILFFCLVFYVFLRLLFTFKKSFNYINFKRVIILFIASYI